MTRFVLDANIALSWCLSDEVDERADYIAEIMADGAQAVVPPLWLVETVNGLTMAVRRKRIAKHGAEEKLAALLELPITIYPQMIAWQDFARQLFQLSGAHNLTAYDACYLGLAQELHIPIATLDGQLAKAAQDADIQVIPGLKKIAGK